MGVSNQVGVLASSTVISWAKALLSEGDSLFQCVDHDGCLSHIEKASG